MAMRMVLAHGAGAGQTHPWMTRVVKALGPHGIDAATFNFPYMDAGKSVPDKPAVLEAHFARVWKDVAGKSGSAMIAAGKSMGGRIASQVTAAGGFTPAPVALIFFGYPLHPPNQPGKRRDAHLPRITVPMLFLHGTRDPFGTPEEMRELVASLPTATLHLVDGGDHSLIVRRTRTSGPSTAERAQRSEPGGVQGAPPMQNDSVERAVDVAADWLTTIGVVRH